MPFSRSRLVSLVAFAFPLTCVLAQQVDSFSGENRNFVFVHDKVTSASGSWGRVSELQTYAHTHPGRYIAFEQNKVLYRLDDATALDQAERIYAPMAALDARQHELELQQKPLVEQQRTLAAQQKAAEGNPSEQGRIGAEQGRIGGQQGEIGRKQGEIGQQQGEIGRAFYNKVTSLIDACLAQNTCHRVQS